MGRLASKSSAAKVVSLSELMVYKVLEHLGFGCETHFLQRSCEVVFIATLDAGNGGSFNSFKKATGYERIDGDETYYKNLWGFIQTIKLDSSEDGWAIETLARDNGNFTTQSQ